MTIDNEFDRSIDDEARAIAPTGSCPSEESYLAFYNGSLSEADAEALRDHLAACSRCVEVARDAHRFVAAMQAERTNTPRATRTVLYAAAAMIAGVALVVTAMRWTGRGDSGAPGLVEIAPAPYVSSDELVWRGGPSDPQASLDAAAARYRAGDYRGAVADLDAFVSRHPDDGRARFYLGVARLLSGDAPRAVVELERAAALPAAPEATGWYLALARLNSNDRAGARRGLEVIAASGDARAGDARELLRKLGSRERE